MPPEQRLAATPKQGLQPSVYIDTTIYRAVKDAPSHKKATAELLVMLSLLLLLLSAAYTGRCPLVLVAHRSSLWVSRQADHGDGRPLQPLFGLGTIVPPQGGVHTTGTTYYSSDCPLGTFVAGFTTTNDQGSVPMVHPWVITSGDGDLIAIAVTSLWPIRCNKGKPAGSNSKLQKLSKSRRLIILSDKRSTGYSGVTLYTGKPVDAVSLLPVGTKYDSIGGFPGLPGHTHVVLCPTGQVFTGIYGEATAAHVISAGLRCKAKE